MTLSDTLQISGSMTHHNGLKGNCQNMINGRCNVLAWVIITIWTAAAMIIGGGIVWLWK